MTNKQIIEQTAARFFARGNAALAAAEDLEDSILSPDAFGHDDVDRATDLRYAGKRDAIVAFALIGKKAPAEIVGAEAAQLLRPAMYDILADEVSRVGRLDTLTLLSSDAPLRVKVCDLRISHKEESGTVIVNIGRLIEELRREVPGSGADGDGVMRAAKRAQLTYEAPTLTTTAINTEEK